MTKSMLRIIVYAIACLLFAGIALAGLPALKEYQREAYIERLQNMQEEQHNLAQESRNRENQHRQQALELITLAEREEEIQRVHGDRWNYLQADILFFQGQ